MDIELTGATALIVLWVALAVVVVSVLAITLLRRFGWSAAFGLGAAAVLIAAIQGSRTWSAEAPEVHWGNQELTRVADWVVHLATAGATIVLPTFVAIGIAAALRRTHARIGTQIAVTSIATLAAVGLGISLMLIIGTQMYRDGP